MCVHVSFRMMASKANKAATIVLTVRSQTEEEAAGIPIK